MVIRVRPTPTQLPANILHTSLHSTPSMWRPWDSSWCLSKSPSWSAEIFSHGWCSVRTTEGSLPCEIYLLAPLTRNEKWSKKLMVFRVSLHTNSVPGQDSSCPLAIFTKCVMPVRQQLVFEQGLIEVGRIIQSWMVPGQRHRGLTTLQVLFTCTLNNKWNME